MSAVDKEKETAANKVWSEYQALEMHALQGKWSEVKAFLDVHNPEDFATHRYYLGRILDFALRDGQSEILRQISAQGYPLSKEAATDALLGLTVRFYKEGREDIIRFLVQEAGAETEECLDKLAEKGTPAAMHAMKEAGCDIRRPYFFTRAFDCSNIEMMQYLFLDGADIYNFTNREVRNLYKSLDKPPASVMFDLVVNLDCIYFENLYTKACPPDRKPTLEEFRQIPPHFEERGMTLMHIAARAGRFADVVETALQEKKDPLDKGDFLRTDNRDERVLSILAVRGELAVLFDARLWHKNQKDAVALHERLKEHKLGDEVDMTSFMSEVYQANLGRHSTKIRIIRPGMKP